MLDAYTPVTRTPLTCGRPLTLDGGLTVTAFPLGAKRPRYVAARGEAGRIGSAAGEWVVGLRISDGRSAVVYAPCLAAWSDELTRADLVLLDGTFFTDDELSRRTGVDRSARQMGHLPIEESLPLLARGPRYLYTHLNNTNPVADPGSPERALLRRFGADVAEDGALVRSG